VGGEGFPVAPPMGTIEDAGLAAGFTGSLVDFGVAVGGAVVGADGVPRIVPTKPRDAGSHLFSDNVRAASTPCAVAPAATRTEPLAAVKKSAQAIEEECGGCQGGTEN
jgi:hypothetical protein